ncbi:glycogen synthase GlgA [Geminicoccaceae bacterium 1502E]|nr:glycogen synthase GlgA [Geminicoccaceae bacterium 1502E]
MQVLSLASECFPLVKTGGLADVMGALPPALAPLGCRLRTLLPAYPCVLDALPGAAPVAALPDLFGGDARILEAQGPDGLDLLLLDAPHLYARPGSPYHDPTGSDWPDNWRRFAGLAWAARDIGLGLLPGWRPDIVHAHDWQAGLAPAYLALAAGNGGGPRPATVMTVHNLAFQGQVDPGLMAALRLPPETFAIDGVEYYGGIGFLKAGLFYADRLTTVSPSYAREIRTDEGGMGMGGLLRLRGGDLEGIRNGIDERVWDPARDPHLPSAYGPDSLQGKTLCKAALQRRLRLAENPDALLLGVVSRLSHQKGLDLLPGLLPWLMERGCQLALLGAGEPALEATFAAAALAHPGRIGFVQGYDEPLAHLIQAGSDAILVPSRFEPCGLTQLCAQRYGSLPLVARVGGLADTVIDANDAALDDRVATGLHFHPVTAEALAEGLDRLLRLWSRPEAWRTVQARAMTRDLGWSRPARHYHELYEGLLRHRD